MHSSNSRIIHHSNSTSTGNTPSKQMHSPLVKVGSSITTAATIQSSPAYEYENYQNVVKQTNPINESYPISKLNML